MISGGMVNVVWPFESVVDTKTGFESVVSGFSVIVLVAVGVGVCALACAAFPAEFTELALVACGAVEEGTAEPAFVACAAAEVGA